MSPSRQRPETHDHALRSNVPCRHPFRMKAVEQVERCRTVAEWCLSFWKGTNGPNGRGAEHDILADGAAAPLEETSWHGWERRLRSVAGFRSPRFRKGWSLSMPSPDACRTAVGRVAVVTAPAGYGKTSQVAAWAHSDGRPVAWATIDRWSNDPDHFLSLLLGMLQHVTGVDPGEFASPPVDAEQYETVVASSLGRLVRDCPAPFVLVLDDAHIVDQAPATDLLRTVVDNVPPVSTVVLIRVPCRTRRSPGFGSTRVSSTCRWTISSLTETERSSCSDRWASRSPTSSSSRWWNRPRGGPSASGWSRGLRIPTSARSSGRSDTIMPSPISCGRSGWQGCHRTRWSS